MAHLNNIEKMASCLRKAAHPLLDASDDFTPLVELIGDKPIVLLGESTHGTHEFYHARMLIARRLIEERGFESIVLEADWPDCLHLNRHLHTYESDSYTMASLDAFKRFPQWMWRNSDFLAMADWLFVHNRKETTANQVSVFGMDLYSLYTSIREVIHYLDRVDPQAGQRARDAYSCFAGYERDPVRYGRAIRIGTKASCDTDAGRFKPKGGAREPAKPNKPFRRRIVLRPTKCARDQKRGGILPATLQPISQHMEFARHAYG
jgi:erythromycin esterase-like protein